METIENSPDSWMPLILIVDDVPKNLQVLGNILKRRDCQISVALDGLKALKLVEEIQPDLILLDILMPEMDGYEVCAKLKSMEKTRDIPVIFLTAKTESQDIVRGFEIGAVDYITKPFISAELLVRVDTHLSLKHARDVERRHIDELQESLNKVKLLSGLLPICANCKKIRDDKGYWNQVESYISSHSEANFTHGICPPCMRALYPELYPPEEKIID